MMFSLTPQERQVILFFATVALIGIGINFFAKTNAGVKLLPGIKEYIGKIDLNTADEDLLMGIPGIGEKLSERIIRYRQQHGRFNDLEELKNIKGMHNATYEKIKDSVVAR